MIERLNRELFLLLNATPDSPSWAIQLATWLARDLIFIVPLLAVALWLWGPRRAVPQQRGTAAARVSDESDAGNSPESGTLLAAGAAVSTPAPVC